MLYLKLTRKKIENNNDFVLSRINANLEKINDLSINNKLSNLFIFDIPSKSGQNFNKDTSITII